LPFGDGDVTGPGSAVADAVVRFDGTGGKTVQSSDIVIDDDENISGVQTVAFKTISTLQPAASAVTLAFDDYQKVIVDLDDNASVTVTLNTPNGPGNFMIVFIQGGSTPTTSFTWVTEGTHALWDNISIEDSTDERTLVGLFYDGTTWYGTSSAVTQTLAT